MKRGIWAILALPLLTIPAIAAGEPVYHDCRPSEDVVNGRTVHKTVKGKYKTTHKKVVSNFRKERMGRISFLNPRSSADCHRAALCPSFSVRLRRGAYEIFMYRSGLPNGHLAMLVFRAGTVPCVAFVAGTADASRSHVAPALGLNDTSNAICAP